MIAETSISTVTHVGANHRSLALQNIRRRVELKHAIAKRPSDARRNRASRTLSQHCAHSLGTGHPRINLVGKV